MSKVLLSAQARTYFRRAPHNLARQFADAFRILEETPRPPGAKRLKGELAGLWSLRVGGFRIVYEILGEESIVRVAKIRPRGEIY